MNSSLSSEELKGLFDVIEGGSYKARYGMATFQKKKPKIFAINNTRSEMAQWCLENGLGPLQEVFDRDDSTIKKMDNNEQALAKRAIIRISFQRSRSKPSTTQTMLRSRKDLRMRRQLWQPSAVKMRIPSRSRTLESSPREVRVSVGPYIVQTP